jgi:hypothetical protein
MISTSAVPNLISTSAVHSISTSTVPNMVATSTVVNLMSSTSANPIQMQPTLTVPDQMPSSLTAQLREEMLLASPGSSFEQMSMPLSQPENGNAIVSTNLIIIWFWVFFSCNLSCNLQPPHTKTTKLHPPTKFV